MRDQGNQKSLRSGREYIKGDGECERLIRPGVCYSQIPWLRFAVIFKNPLPVFFGVSFVFMSKVTHQDRISAHRTLSGAASATTMPGFMTINAERPPNVGSATSREDDTDSLATAHSPSHIPCVEQDGFDKLASSQPISTVTTQTTDNLKKSVDESPLQLTDQTNLLPFRKILPVFAGLALCAAISALDSVIIATAMPTISTSFNAGSVASWVPSAYMITSTSFQPLYGRFSDIFGRKAALCVAMAVYMLGSLASGFSTSIIQLIVFRGFAGAGGGALQSMAQIVVSDIVSLRDRYVLFLSAWFLCDKVYLPEVNIRASFPELSLSAML